MDRVDVGKTIMSEQELQQLQQMNSKENLQQMFEQAIANAV